MCGTSARGALSVMAREMPCQSAIPRGRTRTLARARSGMHIITQAGVDSRHFFLTSLLSFSRPLQKAGSAWCSACSHLDDGQRRNLIVTYELLIFCKATSLLYLRCLQPSTTGNPKEVTCSQQVSFEFIDFLSFPLTHTHIRIVFHVDACLPHTLIGRLDMQS